MTMARSVHAAAGQRSSDARLELGIAFAAAIVYTLSAARHITGGDSGELATVLAQHGIAHPPGYPLWSILSSAFRLLPGVSPAHAGALMSAVCGALSTRLFMVAARRFGAGAFGAAMGGVLLAFSPLMWRLSTETEVFALHAVTATAILVASSRGGAITRGQAILLGVAFGLGLSNHHTTILLAPLALARLANGATGWQERFFFGAYAAIGVVIGLAPYGVLLVPAPEGAWSWGRIGNVDELLHHVLRADYGTFRLAASEHERESVEHVSAWIGHLVGTMPIAAAAGAFGGGSITVRAIRERAQHPERARGLIGLVLSLALAGPLFIGLFNIPLSGVGPRVVERFYLLPDILLTLLAAVALGPICERLEARSPWANVLSCTMAVAIFEIPIAHAEVIRDRSDVLERYADDVLSTVPARAIVITHGDHQLGSLVYARHGLGKRSDVTIVGAKLLLADWHRERVARAIGVELPEPRDHTLAFVPTLAAMLSTDREVYMTEPIVDRLAAPTYPIGPVIRVVHDPALVPEPARLFAMNREAERRYLNTPDERASAGTWASATLESYARPWATLATALEQGGDRAAAEEAGRRRDAWRRAAGARSSGR